MSANVVCLMKTTNAPYLQCYAQTDVPAKCRPPLDDYVECLHHTNEACHARSTRPIHTHRLSCPYSI